MTKKCVRENVHEYHRLILVFTKKCARENVHEYHRLILVFAINAYFDLSITMLMFHVHSYYVSCSLLLVPWAPSQYPIRRLFVRSRKVSKPRDLYLELSDCSGIWQALRQHCCRCACQISKRYDNLKYQSRGFETSRDLTKRRLFGYWDGAQ